MIGNLAIPSPEQFLIQHEHGNPEDTTLFRLLPDSRLFVPAGTLRVLAKGLGSISR